MCRPRTVSITTVLMADCIQTFRTGTDHCTGSTGLREERLAPDSKCPRHVSCTHHRDFNLEEDTVIAALLHDTLEDTDLATKLSRLALDACS
ncbi:MAG: hypothetical protein CM1200mP25_4850 [Acidobacteriota bacterium]|nr:MAG: hypothetical protein CM1200mP25_4850 [Acidobacteriota bacterium]